MPPAKPYRLFPPALPFLVCRLAAPLGLFPNPGVAVSSGRAPCGLRDQPCSLVLHLLGQPHRAVSHAARLDQHQVHAPLRRHRAHPTHGRLGREDHFVKRRGVLPVVRRAVAAQRALRQPAERGECPERAVKVAGRTGREAQRRICEADLACRDAAGQRVRLGLSVVAGEEQNVPHARESHRHERVVLVGRLYAVDCALDIACCRLKVLKQAHPWRRVAQPQAALPFRARAALGARRYVHDTECERRS
eukprot:scaffold591_cov121-Isochrysis_galbana.AAC.2